MSVAVPLEILDAPYLVGGEDPTGMDCWGAVVYVYRSAGMEPPTLPEVAASFDANDKLRAGRGDNPEWLEVTDDVLKDLDIVVWYPDFAKVSVGVVVDPMQARMVTSVEGIGVKTMKIRAIKGEIVGIYRRSGG